MALIKTFTSERFAALNAIVTGAGENLLLFYRRLENAAMISDCLKRPAAETERSDCPSGPFCGMVSLPQKSGRE